MGPPNWHWANMCSDAVGRADAGPARTGAGPVWYQAQVLSHTQVPGWYRVDTGRRYPSLTAWIGVLSEPGASLVMKTDNVLWWHLARWGRALGRAGCIACMVLQDSAGARLICWPLAAETGWLCVSLVISRRIIAVTRAISTFAAALQGNPTGVTCGGILSVVAAKRYSI